jgi:hypothetical protein
MEAIPLAATAAVDCARALVFLWITHFGVPTTITSDRWLQFTSTLWAAPCEMLDILHHQTTAYHPKVNGAVERLPRHLKDSLQACAATVTWAEEIPWVLLGLCRNPEKNLVSPLLKQFMAPPPLVLSNEFLQVEECSLDQTINKFF